MTIRPPDGGEIRAVLLAILVAIVVGALVGWFILVGRARANDVCREHRDPVTEESCCSTYHDCLPVLATDLIETPTGWRLLPSGEFIPRDRGLESRDGRTWMCRHPEGTVRCFFYPKPPVGLK